MAALLLLLLLLLILRPALILELVNSSVDTVADCDIFCYGGSVKKRLFYPLRRVVLCNFRRGVRAGEKLKYVENTLRVPKDHRYRIFRRERVWQLHTSRLYKC